MESVRGVMPTTVIDTSFGIAATAFTQSKTGQGSIWRPGIGTTEIIEGFWRPRIELFFFLVFFILLQQCHIVERGHDIVYRTANHRRGMPVQ